MNENEVERSDSPKGSTKDRRVSDERLHYILTFGPTHPAAYADLCLDLRDERASHERTKAALAALVSGIDSTPTNPLGIHLVRPDMYTLTAAREVCK